MLLQKVDTFEKAITVLLSEEQAFLMQGNVLNQKMQLCLPCLRTEEIKILKGAGQMNPAMVKMSPDQIINATDVSQLVNIIQVIAQPLTRNVTNVTL